MPVIVWCFNNNEEKENVENNLSKFIADKIIDSTTPEGVNAVINYLENDGGTI